MSAIEWTTRCIEVTKTLDIDVELRNNVIVEQWVLSGLRHARQNLIEAVSEDILKNSSIYNLIIERGIGRGWLEGFEEGWRKGWLEGFEEGWWKGFEEGRQEGGKAFAIEHILEVLNDRFKVNAVATLTPALEAIDDLEVFKGLIRSALTAEHLEDFFLALENSVNGTQ